MPEKSTTPAAKAELTKSESAKTVQADAPENPAEVTYSRERLVSESQQLLQTPGFITAGGLALLDGDGDLTLAEAKQAIDDFGSYEFEPSEEGN